MIARRARTYLMAENTFTDISMGQTRYKTRGLLVYSHASQCLLSRDGNV